MANVLKRLFGFLFDSDQQWWLEVKTTEPACTYYFGPFETESEAELQKTGYLDDTTRGSQGVVGSGDRIEFSAPATYSL